MLKKMCGLFLGLVVLAGSACVTPTHASSADAVIITRIQPSGATGAREELIVLHNNTVKDVDITDTCLVNKALVTFACFSSSSTKGALSTFVLPAYGYATVASEEYVSAHNYDREYYSLVYSVTNQSSGSMVGNSDSISLITAQREKTSSKSWDSSLSTGKVWARIRLISGPDVYAVNNETNDWVVENASEPPLSDLAVSVTPVSNEPPNNNGTDPSGNPGGEGVLSPMPIISELLPNPAGSDTDGEFIELYNPSDTEVVSLDNLKVRIGTDNPKWYDLPSGVTITPRSYLSFSNSELGFTLVNTTGRVQLFMGTSAIGDAVEYTSPKDNQAWALIDGTWVYSDRATPGAANELVLGVDEDARHNDTDESALVQKACAANQYRNSETGRCKLISSVAESSPTPCKEGQERSSETNRCRNVVVAVTPPTPCKEGQERNPETNRCRTVVKMTDAAYKTQGIQATSSAQLRWYYWLAIAGVIVLVIGYAVWEWREEIRSIWNRIQKYFWKLVRK